ncbi:MAG: hypothetical protein WBV36_05505 [Terriglobales bacterium]
MIENATGTSCSLLRLRHDRDLGRTRATYHQVKLSIIIKVTDDGGIFTSFDVPLAGAPVTIPRSINDKGQIAGFYTDITSTYFGFVASFK